MNLDNHPTPEQLRQLLAECDDYAGHHLLWVSRNGDVHISTIQHPYVDVDSIRNEPTVVRFEQEHPEMQFRCETFLRGKEYVGPEAAADDEWIPYFFDLLLSEWRKTKGSPEVAYLSVSDEC
jgi:hypothetical protein